MPAIIGAKFKDKGKTYFFDPKNIQFAVGDGVIVETSRGTEYASVSLANTQVDPSEIKGELKPVVRKATEKDAAAHRANAAIGGKPQAGYEDCRRGICFRRRQSAVFLHFG